MIREKELLNSITRVKDNTENADFVVAVVRYDTEGKNDKAKKKKLTDQEACALQLTAGKNKIYKIKAKRGNELFNPQRIGMLYSLDMMDRITNDAMFKFKEVTEKAFQNYVSFLQTKQESLLNMAERDVIHA